MLGHALLAPPRPAYPAPASSATLRPQHGYYAAFTAALEVLLGLGLANSNPDPSPYPNRNPSPNPNPNPNPDPNPTPTPTPEQVLLGPGGHGISFSYGDLDADADAALGEAGGGAGLRVLLRTGAGFLRRESLRVYGEPLSTPTPPSILPFSSIAPAQP